MERMMPIAVAFALGAVAASLAQLPTTTWSQTASVEEVLLNPVSTPSRYPMPAYATGLRGFTQ